MKILVADSIATAGVELLEAGPGFQVEVRTGMTPAELKAAVQEIDALVVRSATQVSAEILAQPGRLKVIGRAGTGVDNIDLEAATRAGVVVLNTPGGNSLAAAELTVSLLLAFGLSLGSAFDADAADKKKKKSNRSRKNYMPSENTAERAIHNDRGKVRRR